MTNAFVYTLRPMQSIDRTSSQLRRGDFIRVECVIACEKGAREKERKRKRRVERWERAPTREREGERREKREKGECVREKERGRKERTMKEG